MMSLLRELASLIPLVSPISSPVCGCRRSTVLLAFWELSVYPMLQATQTRGSRVEGRKPAVSRGWSKVLTLGWGAGSVLLAIQA